MSDILFPCKSSFSNLLKFTFLNTFISDITFDDIFNSFNSLALNLSNMFISDISLPSK